MRIFTEQAYQERLRQERERFYQERNEQERFRDVHERIDMIQKDVKILQTVVNKFLDGKSFGVAETEAVER